MIGALAQSDHPNHRWRWTGALLAAVYALLVAVAGAAPAAAISASGPRIAVGAGSGVVGEAGLRRGQRRRRRERSHEGLPC